MRKILILSLLLVLLSACAQPGNIGIISKNKDYQDYVASLTEKPEFTIVEETRLTDELIQSRLTALNGSAYSLLYQNLTDTGSLYVVRLQDTKDSTKGIITIIDVAKNTVLRLYATLDVELGGTQ